MNTGMILSTLGKVHRYYTLILRSANLYGNNLVIFFYTETDSFFFKRSRIKNKGLVNFKKCYKFKYKLL